MTDVRAKHVPPSAKESAFNCPHCGALATQTWYSVHADRLGDGKIPAIIDEEYVKSLDLAELDKEEREKTVALGMKMASGLPYIEESHGYRNYSVWNIYIAKCFNCKELSVWVYNRMIYPAHGEATMPNTDLSPDVLRDYREASTILDDSPRGAAALLRLAIQKMCKELGGAGANINDDIALFVQKGLDIRVQQALDVVRVVGNNAVHPGLIDLRDDRATAEKLFALVNLIADIMISQPKHLQAMFDGLPENARDAIKRRDGKA